MHSTPQAKSGRSEKSEELNWKQLQAERLQQQQQHQQMFTSDHHRMPNEPLKDNLGTITRNSLKVDANRVLS